VAFGVSISWPRPARAGASAHLVYLRGPGAEQCPGEAAIRAAVSSRLGYDPFFAWAHDTLFAEIDRSGDAFRAVVKLVDADNHQRGARELSVRGSDCSAVIDVLALTISLTIDPAAAMGTASPETAPEAPAAKPPEAPPAAKRPEGPRPMPPGGPDRTLDDAPPTPAGAPVDEAPGPRPPNPSSLRAGLGVLAAVNTAAAPNAGFTLAIGGGWRIFSFDLEGRADVPSQGISKVQPMQVRSWLFAGSLVPCIHVEFLYGCAVGAVGAIGVTATRVAQAFERYGAWWALGGRIGAEWAPASRLVLRAYVEGLGTMQPADVVVDTAPIYRFSPWSADLGVAAAWRFL
jgi:hypothetical protein